MGDKVVDAKVIKKTQDTLGRIIKKPPLTEKLLQKPPFRFLHDVVTSVIKTTGFMKGLFTETEMNSENVKDKDSKIAFLQKLIDMVSLVIGKPVAAKPSKIVAGHDADRTNELLQALAEAVNKKVDNDDYVRRVLKSDDSKPAAKKESKPKEEPKQSKSRSADDDGDKDQSRTNEKSKDKEHKSREPDDDNKKEHKQERDRHSRRDGSRDHKRRDDDAKREEENDEKNKRRDQSRDQSRGRREKDVDNQDGGDFNEQKLQRPTSAKGSRRHQSRENDESKKDNRMNNAASQDDDSKQTSTKSRPMRPSSARPAPPKPKKSNVVTEDPVVPGRKVPNVIVDKKDADSDDDDDNDKGFGGDEIDDSVQVMETSKPTEVDADGDADHGGLVKKILETKKELENQPGKKTQIDRSQVLSDATRRKERDNAQHEIDRLRGSVQTLTRSVNPLGKILDFLQEDLDAMQKEMNIWRQENNENTIALQREQSVTDSSVEPLKAQLTELDSQIRDQLDLIAAVKSTILHNDLRVSKMLGAVTKS